MVANSIEEVLTEYSTQLMHIQNVVGIGQGVSKNAPCITVFVSQLTPAIEKQIPHTIAGYEVTITETGDMVSF